MRLFNTLLGDGEDNGGAPKTDAPKTDAPKTDAPKTDAPKTDAPAFDANAAKEYLVSKGGKADELGKLDEAGLKKAFDDAKAAEVAALNKERYGAPADGKYEFKTPEGVKLDAEVQGEFAKLAKELDLSQASAQKVADLGIRLQAKFDAGLKTTIDKVNTDWAQAAKADPEIGGADHEAKLAVAKLGYKDAEPAFRKLINESGLGNHPEVIRYFYRIGKTRAADTTEKGRTGNDTTRSSTFSYPNSKHA
jgi:hypothetical protein